MRVKEPIHREWSRCGRDEKQTNKDGVEVYFTWFNVDSK